MSILVSVTAEKDGLFLGHEKIASNGKWVFQLTGQENWLEGVIQTTEAVSRSVVPEPNQPEQKDIVLNLPPKSTRKATLIIEPEQEEVKCESYWWCPECKIEVGNYNVTFEESHDSCGTLCVSKNQPPQTVEERALEDRIYSVLLKHRDSGESSVGRAVRLVMNEIK